MLQLFENDVPNRFMLISWQYFSLNVYHLNNSIDKWNCSNQAQFLNREIFMKCLVIKIFAWKFLQLPIQKI